MTSWIVVLRCVDSHGNEYEYDVETCGVADTVVGAIDEAIRVCDETIVGVESARRSA